MYFILNERKKIIATDNKLLKLCGVFDIDELMLQIALNKINFNIKADKNITIIVNNQEKNFLISNVKLSTIIGNLTLVEIGKESLQDKTILQQDNSKIEELVFINDDIFNVEEMKELTPNFTTKQDDISLGLSLDLDTHRTENNSTIDNKDKDTFDLGLDLDDMNLTNEKDDISLDLSLDDKDSFDLGLDLDDMNLTNEKDDISLDLSLDDKDSFDLGLDLDDMNLTNEKDDISLDLSLDDKDSFDLGLDLDDMNLTNEKDDISLDLSLDAKDSFDLGLDLDDLTDDISLDLSLDQEIKSPQKTIDNSEILVDINKISKQMGISTNDYDEFLNEYIDTALTLENDLFNAGAKRVEAIQTLKHLGEMLHLPKIGDIINNIDTNSNSDQKEQIVYFYNSLSRITTHSLEVDKEEEELLTEIPKIIETEPIPEKIVDGFGTISLEGIKPIHFDFQLEQAANDLSLPVELIEEFVNDFIDQAHVETKKMLKAYEEGNLDTIQKLGHLLKGTSSNLRIVPLADTLYKIQFCEDINLLEDYIKDYWGHFLSFEHQINIISN